MTQFIAAENVDLVYHRNIMEEGQNSFTQNTENSEENLFILYTCDKVDTVPLVSKWF